jgi:hypothetical protein
LLPTHTLLSSILYIHSQSVDVSHQKPMAPLLKTHHGSQAPFPKLCRRDLWLSDQADPCEVLIVPLKVGN